MIWLPTQLTNTWLWGYQMNKIEFHASVNTGSNAIAFCGAEGIKLVLDIPESSKKDALKLVDVRQKPLLVTVELVQQEAAFVD